MADEEAVPRKFQIAARTDAVFLISTAKQFLTDKLLACRMGQHVFFEHLKMRAAHGLIVVPPDLIFRHLIAHQVFVGGGTPRVLAGSHRQRTVCGGATFAALDSQIEQGLLAIIPADRRRIDKSGALRPGSAWRVGHGEPLNVDRKRRPKGAVMKTDGGACCESGATLRM